MGAKFDKRTQQIDLKNGAIVQVKKMIHKKKSIYPYWGYETKQPIISYQLQLHNTMTWDMKYKIQ